MTERELIDTNILVYAFDHTEPSKQKTAKNTMLARINENKAAVSIQNINEFCNIMNNKKMPAERILQIVDGLTKPGLLKLLSVEKDNTIAAMKILIETKNSHYWDCLIAATMKKNEITTILTENTKDFEKMEGIKAISPF